MLSGGSQVIPGRLYPEPSWSAENPCAPEPGESDEDAWPRLADHFRSLTAYARERNVVIGLHSDYDFIIVSDQFREMDWLDRISGIARLWEADDNIDIIPYTPKQLRERNRMLGRARS